jgi:hypothetical protein
MTVAALPALQSRSPSPPAARRNIRALSSTALQFFSERRAHAQPSHNPPQKAGRLHFRCNFRPEDRSELQPNVMDTQQHRRRGRHSGLFCVEQNVPLVLEKQFEPIEFSTNLGFEMLGQATAIASLKRVEPRTPIATQRLIPGCALREEQSFDPVDVLNPFHDQHLTLTANPAAVFILRRRRPNR